MSRHKLLATLLVLASFALQPATALATDYYFSWETGNDAWDGLTPNQPKKTIREANRILRLRVNDVNHPINRILFHRGESWYDSGGDQVINLTGVSGTSLSSVATRIEINAWGDANLPRPVLSSLNRVSSAQQTWTRMATSGPNQYTWYTTVAYPDALRLYVNGVSKLNVRDTVDPENPPPTLPNEFAVDESHEWFIKASGTNGILYVNTGSANWPQGVEVHRRPQLPTPAIPSQALLFLKNSNYVLVREIDFRGGDEYQVVHIEAPSAHVVFDHNTIKQANASGLFVGYNKSDTTPADYVSDIQITNNLIDKTWTTAENHPARLLSGDGIYLAHAVDTGLVMGNEVYDFGHVGITLTAYREGYRGVHNIRVEDNEIAGPNSGYMHGFDISGGFTPSTTNPPGTGWCTNNVVCRNYIHDYTATCHVLGNDNKVYSNIFANYKRTTMPRHTGIYQPYALDIEAFYSGYAGEWMVARDNIIANNTFYQIQGYAIFVSRTPSHQTGGTNPYPLEGNKIYNNLFLHYGTLSDVADWGVNVRPNIPPDQWNLVSNNVFWNPSVTNPPPATAPVAFYRTQSYNAAQLNGLPECAGNDQVAPVLGNFFQPTGSSPLKVRQGGLDIDSIMGANFLDFNGNAWLDDGGNTPSIGAIQYYAQP